MPRNPPVFEAINSSQRQESHSEALARNAAARQQLEEVIAQHNQRAGFDQGHRQPNHFEAVPKAPSRVQHQQNLSPRKTVAPKRLQQIESSDGSVLRKLSHDEALQQNALHRQQLAEVVAKHADKVDEVTKTLKIPENEDSRESGRAPITSVGQSVDRFLAKKTSSNKSQSTNGRKNTNKSEVSSFEESLVDAEQADHQLVNHLKLLSELDKQVEDLFSQALDIFSEELPDKRPERKGGKGGRRNQGKKKGSGNKTKQKDPRRLAE